MENENTETTQLKTEVVRLRQFVRDLLYFHLGLGTGYVESYQYLAETLVVELTDEQKLEINLRTNEIDVYLPSRGHPIITLIWKVLTKSSLKAEIPSPFKRYIDYMMLKGVTVSMKYLRYALPFERGVLIKHMKFVSALEVYLRDLSDTIMKLLTEKNIRLLLKSDKVLKAFKGSS